jgi:hypothetical protein
MNRHCDRREQYCMTALTMKVTIHWHNLELSSNTGQPIQHGVPFNDYEECKDLKPSAQGMGPEY